MEKYLKLRKHTFKTSTSFPNPWRKSHCLTNASCFPMNSSTTLSFRKHVCQMPGGRPGVRKCPAPGRAKIANAPSPGLTMWANAPRLPGGGGGGMGTAGIHWCIRVLVSFVKYLNRPLFHGSLIEKVIKFIVRVIWNNILQNWSIRSYRLNVEILRTKYC